MTFPGKVSVYYFNGKSMGEGVRLLLAYGGQEFEDRRIEFDEWAAFKPKTPFGGLPILEIDGKQLATVQAICRYLGKKYGLIGDNDEEAFEIDQNVDFLADIRIRAAMAFWDTDEEMKKKKMEEYAKVLPGLLDKLHAIIVKNNGHMAAGKLTWADFHFAGMVDYLKMIFHMPDLTDKYPAFKTIADKVYSIPKVKAWADKSVQTPW
ncbi:glutathione S-transferase 2-like isoform X2 [Anticarsia gemmatalis]